MGRILPGGLRVLRRLGSGRQGTLYQARYPNEVEVGVLVLPTEPEREGPSQRELLERAARIQHPNVALVYATGALEDGTFYAVLEQLVAEPLSQVLAAGTVFGLEDAVDLTLQVASGLQAALRAGCIHGNLAPHTILVATGAGGQRYRVKLTGFSLHGGVRHAGASPAAPGPAAAPYASPERLAGRAPDEPSEVFSVAAVLHHLLSRMPPDQGQVDSAVPDAARRVLARALATAPEQRYPTVAALAEALTALTAARAVAHPERRVARAGSIAAVAAGVALVTWAMWGMPRMTGTSASERLSPPAGTSGIARTTASPAAPAAETTGTGTARARQPGRLADGVPVPAASSPAATPPPARPRAAPLGRELRDADSRPIRTTAEPAQESLPRSSPPATPSRSAVEHEAPEPLGYVGTPRFPLPAPDSAASSAVRTDATPRSRGELAQHQRLREAIGDVRRLGIAEDVVELRPGALIVSLTPSALERPSTMYNLERLYLAYRLATPHDPDASVELRRGNRLYGTFTRDGLILVTGE